MGKKRHSQDEHFTIRGHWWLPTVSQKVAGDLRYTEGELTLSLYGGLNEARIESPFSATPESTEFPVILGETLDAVPVTVLHSFYTHWTPDIQTLAVRPGTSTTIRSSRIHCGKLLEGMHLSSPDERFSRCRVEIPSLEDWLGEVPFATNLGDKFETVRLECTRPSDHEFKLAAMRSAVHLIHTVRPPALPFGNSPTIQHRTYIELEPDEQMSIDRLADQTSEIVGMFAILYGGNVLSRSVTLYRSGPDPAEALLFYPRHAVTRRSYAKMDFAIRYEHVATRFGDILEQWLGAPEAVQRARRMLLASERRPYPNQRKQNPRTKDRQKKRQPGVCPMGFPMAHASPLQMASPACRERTSVRFPGPKAVSGRSCGPAPTPPTVESRRSLTIQTSVWIIAFSLTSCKSNE